MTSLAPSSLPLTPAEPNVTRKPRTSRTYRLSSSRASINSTASSAFSRKRKYTPTASLITLPPEILDHVCSYLSQPDLCSVHRTHSLLVSSAMIALYAQPTFASTYRFAQFVSVISHSGDRANLVRCLDLSMFGKHGHADTPLAGWREWKYRADPLASLRRSLGTGTASSSPSVHQRRGRTIESWLSQGSSTHPLPHSFLRQWSFSRDLPIGAVLHVLEACPGIRKLDLSYLTLTADYAITSSAHRPTAFTSLIFVSDVPKSWTWRATEIRSVKVTDLVEAMVRLPRLECLRIKKGLWLTSDLVTRLVSTSPSLHKANFRGSGLGSGLSWAIKGGRQEILDRLRAMSSESTAR
ncbi:MAG: hypothetical protein M1838_000469 [Thelocarpon superellum]|nr:MAG: hypothetical protein M1838_000469 [Thelocarpon superellum]